MAITHIQQQVGATNANTQTVTLSSNVTAGNSLTLTSTGYGNNLISTVTGGGGTWAKAKSVVGSGGLNGTEEVWYLIGSTGGAGTTAIVVTYASTGNNSVACVDEWSGIAAFDVANSTTGTQSSGSGTASTATLTLAGSGELAIAVLSAQGGGSIAYTNDYTQLSAALQSDMAGYGWASYLIGASTSTSTSFTIADTVYYASVIAAFTPTANTDKGQMLAFF